MPFKSLNKWCFNGKVRLRIIYDFFYICIQVKKRKIHSIYLVSVALAQSQDCLCFSFRFICILYYVPVLPLSQFAQFWDGVSVCAAIECNRSLHARARFSSLHRTNQLMDWLNENGGGNVASLYPVNKCNICDLCRKSARHEKNRIKKIYAYKWSTRFSLRNSCRRGKKNRNRSFMFYYWFSGNVHDWCVCRRV